MQPWCRSVDEEIFRAAVEIARDILRHEREVWGATANDHGHIAWCLDKPVHRYPAARIEPLRYLAGIAEYYAHAVGADPAYSGVLAHNPAPLFKGPYRTTWGRGSAVDEAECFTRTREVDCCGSFGVEPGALHVLDSAIIAGDGGGQRQQAVDTVIATMDEIGMKSRGREAAMADGAGVQVGFRMGAIDGAAMPPEAAT